MTQKQRELAELSLGVAKLHVGVSAIARELGISQPSVSQWLIVPATRARDVARISGVDVAMLRPDLYG